MATEYLHFIILGLIQGLTEFLPISSAAHLILVPYILDWQDQGLAIDVAAHVGTLCAVMFYFRHELRQMIFSWYSSKFSFFHEQSRYVWYLIVATLPIVVIGFFGRGVVENYFRSPLVIAFSTIIFGLFLWWADYLGQKTRNDSTLSWKDVLFIGMLQTFALIPGVSRSGITITAGLILGLERKSAARFSFLMSVPTIFLAGGYEGFTLLMSDGKVDWCSMLVVTMSSFFIAVLTIHYFMKFLNYTGMAPYVIYRLFLGIILLYVF